MSMKNYAMKLAGIASTGEATGEMKWRHRRKEEDRIQLKDYFRSFDAANKNGVATAEKLFEQAPANQDLSPILVKKAAPNTVALLEKLASGWRPEELTQAQHRFPELIGIRKTAGSDSVDPRPVPASQSKRTLTKTTVPVKSMMSGGSA